MSSISLKNCELAQINLLCTFICFHICSCCSIFNDRLACPRSRGQLIYYTTFFLVCQGVFRKFFKFFESFFRKLSSSKHFYAVFCAFLKAPVYYTTNLPFCQGVFRKFFKFFESFFRKSFTTESGNHCTPFVECLYIIPQTLFFVKTFFNISFNL